MDRTVREESSSGSSDNGDVSEGLEEEDETQQIENSKKRRFRVDMSAIKASSVATDDQELDLLALGVTAYDQDNYEEGVMQQIDEALEEETEEKAKSKPNQKQHDTNLSDQFKSFLDNVLRDTGAGCSKDEDDLEGDEKDEDKREYIEVEDDETDEEANDSASDNDEWKPSKEDNLDLKIESDEDDGIEDEVEVDDVQGDCRGRKRKKAMIVKKTKIQKVSPKKLILKTIDDGDEKCYLKRIR